MTELISPAINLAILLGVLGYYLRAPLKSFVSSRHTTMREEIKQVRDQLRRAQENFDEFSSKLKAIDVEIVAFRDQAKQDGLAMKSRILGAAQGTSANIVTDARSIASGAFGDLKEQLRLDIATKVVERAEQLLRDRLTGDDKVRIRREFSSQVENIQ